MIMATTKRLLPIGIQDFPKAMPFAAALVIGLFCLSYGADKGGSDNTDAKTAAGGGDGNGSHIY